MRAISLFSGIEGIGLGLKRAVPDLRVVAYCEADPYCQRVLRARIADGLLDDAPIFDDVRSFEWPEGGADLVFGGFPCQDLSYAGKGAGLAGERSSLWFEFVRIIGVVRPRIVFVENVPAILTRGGSRVVADLAALRYRATWTLVRASDAGAPIRRERFFLLACPDTLDGEEGVGILRQSPGEEREILGALDGERPGVWPLPAPDSLGSLNGIPGWVDRSAALGNAVSPQQAALAFRILWERLTP